MAARDQRSSQSGSSQPGSSQPARIRVLRIIARMNIGGPAIHASLLTRRLDPARYDSTLVYGAEEAGEGNYLGLHGQELASTIYLPELGREIRPGQDIFTLAKIVKIIKRMKPDVVHTHTAKAGAVGRVAAILCRVPVIVHTYHGHVLHGYFSPRKTQMFVGIEKMLARGTSRLLTVTPQVRDDLLAREIGRPDQYTVVPLGFDLERFEHAARFRGELRQELGLAAAVPMVGIVARLVPIKAHELFLAAAAIVLRSFPSCRFVIVGDGERRAELEAMGQRMGIASSLIFMGWRADLERIYADLDVVALTSKNEGSPVALIEGMACTRPAVATRVGGVPDVITDGVTGLLAPDGDAEAVAAGIERLLRNPALAADLAKAAHDRVMARYAATRLLKDLDRLYVDLLAQRGRAVTYPTVDPYQSTESTPDERAGTGEAARSTAANRSILTR
jgi:glycosyltransferase involved in cell wall biosynthesis